MSTHDMEIATLIGGKEVATKKIDTTKKDYSGRNIHHRPHKRALRASEDMRATPKPYGKGTKVGVIRDGKYVNPETGEPIVLDGKKKIDFSTIRINTIGGLE